MTLKVEQNPKKTMARDDTRRHGKAREDTTRHEKAREGTRRPGKAREGTARHEKARARGHGARGHRIYPTLYGVETSQCDHSTCYNFGVLRVYQGLLSFCGPWPYGL